MGLGREGTDQVVRRSQTTPSSPPVARDHDETTQRRQNCLVVGKHPHPTVSYYFRIEDGIYIRKGIHLQLGGIFAVRLHTWHAICTVDY